MKLRLHSFHLFRVFTLTAVLLLAVTVGAQGDTGNGIEATTLVSTFTYHGYLEQSAIPVTAICDFEFSLFDALAAGTQIGSTLTRTNIAISSGLFSVQLDFGATAFDGQDRFLAITTRCPAGAGAYTPLTPRQPVTPAPYSMYAIRAPWSGLQNVPAGFADGVDNTGADWSLTGNGGTTPGSNFLGTTDNQPLEIRVNGYRVMRYEWSSRPNIIGGHWDNTIAGFGATIAGGGGPTSNRNRVEDNFGTISGGENNQAGNPGDGLNAQPYATVGGGLSNTASGAYSLVGGGRGNTATHEYATVGGGINNHAINNAATVSGGASNTASGDSAVVSGGHQNIASGNFSFAAGRRAVADDAGAFVWADTTDANINSPGVNTFTVRASGGIWFGTTSAPSIGAGRFIDTSTGAHLTTGGVWTNSSDENAKENFSPVDAQAVLESLVALPMTTWNYITENDSIRRIGPMAQDFYAAFGVGTDNLSISTIDAQGVAFAAIQGLNHKLEAENAALQSRVEGLEARLATLEGLAGGGQSAALLPVLAVIGGAGLLAGAALRRGKH
jgi:hypothetical protein